MLKQNIIPLLCHIYFR